MRGRREEKGGECLKNSIFGFALLVGVVIIAGGELI